MSQLTSVTEHFGQSAAAVINSCQYVEQASATTDLPAAKLTFIQEDVQCIRAVLVATRHQVRDLEVLVWDLDVFVARGESDSADNSLETFHGAARDCFDYPY